jgi:hypothetical protein
VADKRSQTPNFGFQMIIDGSRWVDMTRNAPVNGVGTPPGHGAEELEALDYNTMLTIIDTQLGVVSAAAAATTSILKSAAAFAVLATSTITNTGATTVYGDIGLQPPGVSVTGFSTASSTVVNGPASTGLVNGPGTDTGTIHIGDAVATQAQTDAQAAYTALKALAAGTDLSGQDLGGKTLTPGRYDFTAAAVLTGTLTIDFQNTPNALVIIRTGTTFTAAASANVNVINAGPTNGLYWAIGSAATFGASSNMAGNFIANTSITFNTSANLVSGRAIALTAAVTMDTNKISRDASTQAFGTGRTDATSLGFSGGTAAAVGVTANGGVLGGGTIAAAGTTAANGTKVVNRNQVVTAADGTKGVTLPSAVPGSFIFLYNSVAAVLKVWPATGEFINALAQDTNIAMAASTSAVFVCGVSGKWFTIPVVPS